MTPSTIERERALNIMYTALTNPGDSGNPFLQRLLDTAKDGYFSLNLLKELVTDLSPYPLTYLRHCIKQDRLDPTYRSRLELSADSTQVRKTRMGDTTSISPETDPYGFLISKSTITETKRKRKADMDEDIPLKNQQRGTYFTPYRPTFNYKALYQMDEKTDNDMDLLPVIFDNGKFYQDSSFFNSTMEEQTKTIPSYNKLDMIPIGSQETYSTTWSPLKVKTCWNCDSPGHETRQCPKPTDKERVAINRGAFLMDKGSVSNVRYYKQLAYDNEISNFEPGRLSPSLRQALGLLNDQDEPPYYHAMRTYGYPPGYSGTYTDQQYVMKLISGRPLSEDAPDLKIYSNNEDDNSEDLKEKHQEQDGSANNHEEQIQMVTYPGLYQPQMTPGDDGRSNGQYKDQYPIQQRQYYPQQEYYQQNQLYQQQQYPFQTHHQPLIQPYYDPQMFALPQELFNQLFYYTLNDHIGQWGNYQSASSPRYVNEHQPNQYQHSLHNQDVLISPPPPPPPPPPFDIEDDIPPPPPPPPIGIEDDIPLPPP